MAKKPFLIDVGTVPVKQAFCITKLLIEQDVPAIIGPSKDKRQVNVMTTAEHVDKAKGILKRRRSCK
jgi:hypothetical protein